MAEFQFSIGIGVQEIIVKISDLISQMPFL